jgi:hypothetical protein
MRREIEHRLSFFETWLRNQRVLNPNNRVFFKFISIIKRGGPLRGLLPLPHGKPREVISVF